MKGREKEEETDAQLSFEVDERRAPARLG